MIENVRLVICDIDFTLVNNARNLTPRTKAVLEQLHAEGYLVGIGSGRPLDEISKYAQNWGLSFEFDVLVGMNGGALWDEKAQKEYSYYPMKKEWLKEVVDMMSFVDNNPFVYKGHKILAKRNDEIMRASAGKTGKEVIVANDLSDFYAEDFGKIMFRVTLEDMQKVEAKFENYPFVEYKGFKTQPTLYEFANAQVSKAYGVRQYCEMNGFSIDEVLAFGDTSNDNEMLKECGWGVCMCNGSDDTKACANEISKFSNDEDGLAIYLEDNLLNK